MVQAIASRSILFIINIIYCYFSDILTNNHTCRNYSLNLYLNCSEAVVQRCSYYEFCKIHKKYLCRTLCLIKLQHFRLINLLKIDYIQVFCSEFCDIFKSTYFETKSPNQEVFCKIYILKTFPIAYPISEKVNKIVQKIKFFFETFPLIRINVFAPSDFKSTVTKNCYTSRKRSILIFQEVARKLKVSTKSFENVSE